MDVDVDIGRNDVVAGVRRSPGRCPLARALNRRWARVFVSNFRAYVRRGPQWYEAVLPGPVMDKLQDFDDGKGMVPFQTRLQFMPITRHQMKCYTVAFNV